MIGNPTTWKYIRRTPYQSLAAVLVMTLTLFIASIFSLSTLGLRVVLKYLEAKPQITAFFKDEVTNDQIDKIKIQLDDTKHVATIKFVSKEDALIIYKEQNKDDPILLEMVTANILPSSLEVSATEATYLKDLYDILKNQAVVEDVMFQKEVVDTLVSWISFVRTTGIVFVSFLAVISISIIIMVIGMKISSRREEIEILKLVGATRWYIRWPFLLEGIIYGLIGALLAWVFSYLLILYSTPFLATFLSGISLLPVPPTKMLLVLLIEVTVGVSFGFLGSYIAIKRYLR